MLKYIDSTKMGRAEHGWLTSRFHFSFAEYYNPENTHFGVLRVVNDDLVEPGTGFDTHPHQNMEILSYVVDGELSHADSMGNEHTLTRGQVQYMSAGTGVQHSEHNRGKEVLRFLQIWIFPDRDGYPPNYGDYRFELGDRQGKWLPIASRTENSSSTAPIRIHQDVNIYAAMINAGGEIGFNVSPGRQAYLVQVEGSSNANGIHLGMRDALEITEEDVLLKAVEDSHFIVLEMKKA